MLKNLFLATALIASLSVFDNQTITPPITGNSCVAQSRNDGSYTRTSHSVTVICESGTNKGSFAVYLHRGQKYINFNGSWICIQGVSSFTYNGNRYYIR